MGVKAVAEEIIYIRNLIPNNLWNFSVAFNFGIIHCYSPWRRQRSVCALCSSPVAAQLPSHD